MAVANYHETYGCFPPAYVADRDGRPLHSWRVLILPFLEQRVRLRGVQLRRALGWPEQPEAGGSDRADLPPLWTRVGSGSHDELVAVVGPQTAWPGGGVRTRADLGDGSHETLMIVEVPDGQFRWMEPLDLQFEGISFRINDGSGRGWAAGWAASGCFCEWDGPHAA